ncbi:MAG: hypothetical protein HFE73_02715 [Firmicutes bacterium]|nr:hypothetical protein [Bacillota bacterium]
MKNLIITVGMMLLMMMGLMYDQDCIEVIRIERRMGWVCEEMAAGAAICQEQGESVKEAKNIAEDILQRNFYLDEGMKPKAGTGILQEPVEWKVVFGQEETSVEVDCGMARLRLKFLEEQARLTAKGTYGGDGIFYEEGSETS